MSETTEAETIATALRQAAGISQTHPAYLEAIAMQLGYGSGGDDTVPDALNAQAEALTCIAKAIDNLAGAIRER